MPYTNVPRELWGQMDRCVAQIRRGGQSKERAVAICYAAIVKKEAVSVALPVHEAAPAGSVSVGESGNLDGEMLVEGRSLNNNIYNEAALLSAIPVFAGQPIFVDHPSKSEQADRPERSVRDMVGRLPGPEGFGLKVGKDGRKRLCFTGALLSESAGWLATLIREGIAGDMSINASGLGHPDGDTFVVEAFTSDAPASLDFVTRAAAGGYAQLRESISQQEDDMGADELKRLRGELRAARIAAREQRAGALIATATRNLNEAAAQRVITRLQPAVKRFAEAGEMPAVEMTLPEDVQAIPEEAQAVWLAAYLDAKPRGEQAAYHLAWAAVYNQFEQDQNGEWKPLAGQPSAEDQLAGEIAAEVDKEKPEEPQRPMEAARRAGGIVGQGSAPAQRVTEADVAEVFKKFGGRHG